MVGIAFGVMVVGYKVAFGVAKTFYTEQKWKEMKVQRAQMREMQMDASATRQRSTSKFSSAFIDVCGRFLMGFDGFWVALGSTLGLLDEGDHRGLPPGAGLLLRDEHGGRGQP